jgi:hypothetical protein
MTAVLTPTEDQVFDAVWQALTSVFPAPFAASVFKGFQNMTATPTGTYVVIQPGIVERQNQVDHDYDPVNGLILENRHSTYSYQIDCYGPSAPDNANIIAIAWRSFYMANYTADNALPFQVLYADEPQQLNFSNGEMQYEQRFMSKIYLQVNQTVSLPQDFFTVPSPVSIKTPADMLPV